MRVVVLLTKKKTTEIVVEARGAATSHNVAIQKHHTITKLTLYVCGSILCGATFNLNNT